MDPDPTPTISGFVGGGGEEYRTNCIIVQSPVFKSQVCKLEGQITTVRTNRSEGNVSYFLAIGYFVGYIAHKFVNSGLKYWGQEK
jgi:hypothetical protein